MTKGEEEGRAALLSELEKAGKRVGQDAESATGWFLRFASRDLSALSAGDMQNLSYEIVFFLGHGVRDEPAASPIESGLKSPLARKGGTYLVKEGEYDLGGSWPTVWKFFPSAADMGRFQAFAASAISSVLRGSAVSLDLPAVELRLSPPTWTPRPFSEDPSALWTYWTSRILARFAARFRVCRECKTIHLADRKNMTFCTRRCQTNDASRRWRERHGLITGRPRGRPRKTEAAKKPKGGKHGESRRKG